MTTPGRTTPRRTTPRPNDSPPNEALPNDDPPDEALPNDDPPIAMPSEKALSVGRARPADVDAIKRLLEDAGLPTRGVDDLVDRFVVARLGSDERITVAAAGAVEPCGRVGLLRSVVVHPDARGEGLGRLITRSLVDAARADGFTALYLLTETAESFFNRTGFETIERDSAPESIRETEEFSSLCPESAVFMRLQPLG